MRRQQEVVNGGDGKDLYVYHMSNEVIKGYAMKTIKGELSFNRYPNTFTRDYYVKFNTVNGFMCGLTICSYCMADSLWYW